MKCPTPRLTTAKKAVVDSGKGTGGQGMQIPPRFICARTNGHGLRRSRLPLTSANLLAQGPRHHDDSWVRLCHPSPAPFLQHRHGPHNRIFGAGALADAVSKLRAEPVVITSVDRDDRDGGGQRHFRTKPSAPCANGRPARTIEILTPEFHPLLDPKVL